MLGFVCSELVETAIGEHADDPIEELFDDGIEELLDDGIEELLDAFFTYCSRMCRSSWLFDVRTCLQGLHV